MVNLAISNTYMKSTSKKRHLSNSKEQQSWDIWLYGKAFRPYSEMMYELTFHKVE